MTWEMFERSIHDSPRKSAFAISGLSILFVLIVGIPLLLLSGGGTYLKTKFFDPVIESNRREAFEQTRSYITGGIQELRKHKREYMLADENDKSILAASIRDQFAEFDRNDFPQDLRAFLIEIDSVQ